MLSNYVVGVAMIFGFVLPSFSQTPNIDKLINDPKNSDVVVNSIFGNHALIMKLIDKLSERPHFVQMMKERFGGETNSSVQTSPYAGQETRSIKALSEAEVKQYLDGEGMGMAKPAELNGYPGPRHVLDVVSQMNINESTKKRITEIYDAMHADAMRLGKQIVEKERNLDSLFRSKAIDASTLKKITVEIGTLQGNLRSTHMKAHLATAALLTPEQISAYEKLRGYDSGAMHHEHHH